jgi:hypothetical protein
VRDGFMRHQGGFSVGGPLKRDKTFLFLNLEHTRDWKDNLLNVPQLNLVESVSGNNSFTYLSARIDQHWSNRWHSSWRVNTGLADIERQGGAWKAGWYFPARATARRGAPSTPPGATTTPVPDSPTRPITSSGLSAGITPIRSPKACPR